MIVPITAALAALGGLYAGTKGVPVRSGVVGDTRWRIRWALWRWKGEAWDIKGGWQPVGDFKTEELARNAAQARAEVMSRRILSVGRSAASGIPARTTSFQRRDI